MFAALFFIAPTVIAVLCGTFALALTYTLPQWRWLSVDIGRLHADDIRKLKNEEKQHFRKKVIRQMLLALLVTLIIGSVAVLSRLANNLIAVVVILLVQLTATAIFLWPIRVAANAVKAELEHNSY